MTVPPVQQSPPSPNLYLIFNSLSSVPPDPFFVLCVFSPFGCDYLCLVLIFFDFFSKLGLGWSLDRFVPTPPVRCQRSTLSFFLGWVAHNLNSELLWVLSTPLYTWILIELSAPPFLPLLILYGYVVCLPATMFHWVPCNFPSKNLDWWFASCVFGNEHMYLSMTFFTLNVYIRFCMPVPPRLQVFFTALIMLFSPFFLSLLSLLGERPISFSWPFQLSPLPQVMVPPSLYTLRPNCFPITCFTKSFTFLHKLMDCWMFTPYLHLPVWYFL